MFGIGPSELLIILVIVMIFFGVGKLPEIGKGLGKGIREFREASKGPAELDPGKKETADAVKKDEKST